MVFGSQFLPPPQHGRVRGSSDARGRHRGRAPGAAWAPRRASRRASDRVSPSRSSSTAARPRRRQSRRPSARATPATLGGPRRPAAQRRPGLRSSGRGSAAQEAAAPAALGRRGRGRPLMNYPVRSLPRFASPPSQISESGLGWAVAAALATLARRLRAPVSLFADWWARETWPQPLLQPVTSGLPGAHLVERQGATLRFKSPTLPQAAALGGVFDHASTASAPSAASSPLPSARCPWRTCSSPMAAEQEERGVSARLIVAGCARGGRAVHQGCQWPTLRTRL